MKAFLDKNNGLIFVLFASFAAFATYSCMYALRKPIAVASFEALNVWGIDYKVLVLSAQVIGYALSKFIGIKVVSEIKAIGRIKLLILFLGIAAFALFLFAIMPYPYNAFILVLNGLPLGMIWGIVFSFLEGRKFTEILGAVLSASFIFSSGLVKSVGKYIMMNFDVGEFWMPFLTGLVFFPVLAISIWMLSLLPHPTSEDEQLRTKREPMTAEERWRFFSTFAPGLIMLIIAYVILTVIRDFRDNFAVEIWTALGYSSSPEIFTVAEIPVAIIVLVMIGTMFLIKNNFTALLVSHLLIIIGSVLVLISTYLFHSGLVSPPIWMILVGTGLYMGYVPFNSMFFDRLIASFKYVSNVGFLIYLVDSFGYLGSTLIMFYKNFSHSDSGWYEFFVASVNTMPYFVIIMMTLSALYFNQKYKSFKTKLDGIELGIEKSL